MPKTTKPERKALFALDDAAAASRFANQAAKTLPAKQAKKLRALAKDAKAASDASQKAIRKNPKKIAKRADKVTDRTLKATETALDRQQAKAAEKAKKLAAERKAAEKKAAAKKAAAAKAAEKKAVKKAVPTKAAVKTSAQPAATAAPSPAEPELVETITELAPISEAVDESVVVVAPERLDSLSVVALRALAREQGRTGYSRLSKAQLVDLVS